MKSDDVLVDDKWRETFVLRLRMKNVPGAQIGDALRTVEAHCAETGESAREAFGDPREYADSLGLGRPTPISTYVLAVPAFLGANFLASGLPAIISGDALAFRWPEVAGWLLMIVGMIGLVALDGRRRGSTPSYGFVIGLALLLAIPLGLAIVGRDAPVLGTANAWIVTAAGALMLGAAAMALVRQSRRNRIADPLDGSDMLGGSETATWVVAVAFPAVMIALVVVLALTTAS